MVRYLHSEPVGNFRHARSKPLHALVSCCRWCPHRSRLTAHAGSSCAFTSSYLTALLWAQGADLVVFAADLPTRYGENSSLAGLLLRRLE